MDGLEVDLHGHAVKEGLANLITHFKKGVIGSQAADSM